MNQKKNTFRAYLDRYTVYLKGSEAVVHNHE